MTTNLSELTNTAGPILSLDLGKYKSVACIYVSAEDARFTTITTSRTELTRLFGKCRPSVVLIEACLLCGWVCDLCQNLGIPCLAANTSSEAWKFKHLKRKTDRDDALRLVEAYRLGKFPSVAIPQKEVREKRALIEQRQKLVGQGTAMSSLVDARLSGTVTVARAFVYGISKLRQCS